MRAIILAAGEGSRLRPFTVDKPKPMVRAANKPILQHAIEALAANGVRDHTLVAGYHREKIQSYFGDGRKFGVRITYAFQDALTGTARALATAPAPDDEFLVLSGDNVIDASVVKAALDAPANEPAVVLHRSPRPQRYGVARLDGQRVVELLEKPTHVRSEWVSTGIYRLPPGYHARATALAETPNAGLPDIIQHAIVAGEHIRGVRTEGLWSDAVYPWDLLRLHADVLATLPSVAVPPGVNGESPNILGRDTHISPGTHIGAGTCIGNNVVVGSNCVLENCVVYDDAQIGAGSILRNTIIGAGTRIGPRFTALSDACDIQSVDGWHHLDDFGAVIGEDCRIGGAVTALPGTILGNHAVVAHGSMLRGLISDRAQIL